ncbi:MAG: LptF/LptG family permease [Hyphomicrobiaceae bacterium]
MTAGGANIWTIAKPLLVLAVIVSGAVATVNHLAMPWSLRLLRTYIVQVRADLISQVLQPGNFSTPEQNLTIHIRERDLNGRLLGLVMHDARSPKLISTYLAEQGEIIKQDGTAYLLMAKGHILRRPEDGGDVQQIEFQRYAVDLARFEPKQSALELKPRERYYDELVHPAKDDSLAKAQAGLLRAELHERFSSPLYPFAFVLLAVAFIGHARTTRQNRVNAIIAAFVLAMAARLAGMAGTNVVALKTTAIPLVYAIPSLASAVALAMLLARRQLRPPSALARTLNTWTQEFAHSLTNRSASLFRRRVRAARQPGHQ